MTHKASTGNRRLVVVASLLDKRPNIAGLCRTAELIGGCELVVHDKELLDHEQSRAISQSAENSLAITEIPVPWLLEYLEDKKRHGFKIIAVEQTSSSISVETYEWPEQVLLLLGKVHRISSSCSLPLAHVFLVFWCLNRKKKAFQLSFYEQSVVQSRYLNWESFAP